MKFLSWIRQVTNRIMGKSVGDVKRVTGLDVSVSDEMINTIDLWDAMYKGVPEWTQNTSVVSCGLAADIAWELARLTTLELKSEVSGSVRADFLNTQYAAFISQLRNKFEYGLALGGMAFKPFIFKDNIISIDFVPANRFFPTGYNASGTMTGGIFVDRFTAGRRFYTRFECHELNGDVYTVRNEVYMSYEKDSIGTRTTLEAVSIWENLTKELRLSGIKKPLFGYFNVPITNNIDTDSPLGISVYARAKEELKQADEQWSRLLWEFEGTELAIDVSDRAFNIDSNGRLQIPKGYKRLFRPVRLGTNDAPLYNVFSPEIRENELYKGFQDIIRRIEFKCGLSYGTLSDPSTVEKTAEEIKSSKQRSFSTVSTLQAALQTAMEDTLYAMDVWTTIYNLAPAGNYEVSFSWDDSIIVDTDKEFAQRIQMCSAGILKPEILIAWYFGCSEEEALKMLPKQGSDADLFGLNNA